MGWLSLQLEVDEAQAASLSDAFVAAGALAIVLEDAEAGSVAEAARYGEPGELSFAAWPRTRMSVMVEEGSDTDSLVRAATHSAGLAELPEYRTAPVPEDDWVRRTQSQFLPISIGKRLWIVPTWHEPPADAGAVIRIDPGVAFGTGAHATTRLALEWLARRACSGALLDYGCGSGILALAAARLGAARVDAVDIDPQARRAARGNARRNDVAVRVLSPDELPPGQYDIVISNILAKPLALLAPLLAGRVRRGGRIALTGILKSQAQAVIESYAQWIELDILARADDWVLLAGARK